MSKRMVLLLAMLVFVMPALAHHGWSEYDSSRTLTLTGVIGASGYEHPHGHIRLQVEGKSWQVVLAPPSRITCCRGPSARCC